MLYYKEPYRDLAKSGAGVLQQGPAIRGREELRLPLGTQEPPPRGRPATAAILASTTRPSSSN